MEVDVFLRAKLSAGVGSEGGTTRELKVRDSSSDPDRRWWMIHVPGARWPDRRDWVYGPL